MKRLRLLSKAPVPQAAASVDVKLSFMGNFIDIAIPLVQNKDGTNPTAETTGTET